MVIENLYVFVVIKGMLSPYSSSPPFIPASMQKTARLPEEPLWLHR
jgi:hypothetical protein